MSLPFIFKPYVIRSSVDPGVPCGVYVDGGVLNNLPFREFDGEPLEAGSAAVGDRRQTLGLRLEIVPTEEVHNIGQLVGRALYQGFFGTGESQVLSKYVDQTILLDTRGLDLIDFQPKERDREAAIRRARRTTREYFGQQPDPRDADPADDRETQALRAAAERCW